MANVMEGILIAWVWFIWILKWFWWAILLLIMFRWRAKHRKYPLDVVLKEKRGNAVIKSSDRAGRFSEADISFYRLQKSKDTIPIYEYDWIMVNADLPTTIFDTIFKVLVGTVGTIELFKYGSKQYKPIVTRLPDETEKTSYEEIKIPVVPSFIGKLFGKKTTFKSSYINVYHPIKSAEELKPFKFEVVDWDNMNFMVQEQRATLERRKRIEERWQKLAPVLFIAGGVLCFIIAAYFSAEIITKAMGQAGSAVTQAKPAKIPVISDLINPPGA